MGVKDNSGEGLERKDSCREINHCLREHIQHHEQDVARNPNVQELLVSSQPEVRSRLRQTVRKVILITQ